MDRPLSELFVAFADYCMRRGIGGPGWSQRWRETLRKANELFEP